MTKELTYSITVRRAGVAFDTGGKSPQCLYKLEKLVNRTYLTLRDGIVAYVGAKLTQDQLDYVHDTLTQNGTLTVNAE
jgi:hypothetical protein